MSPSKYNLVRSAEKILFSQPQYKISNPSSCQYLRSCGEVNALGWLEVINENFLTWILTLMMYANRRGNTQEGVLCDCRLYPVLPFHPYPKSKRKSRW